MILSLVDDNSLVVVAEVVATGSLIVPVDEQIERQTQNYDLDLEVNTIRDGIPLKVMCEEANEQEEA